jgi:hypothetical protein
MKGGYYLATEEYLKRSQVAGKQGSNRGGGRIAASKKRLSAYLKKRAK